jgi:hypothetical protein
MFQRRPEGRPSSEKIYTIFNTVWEKKKVFEKSIINEVIMDEYKKDSVSFRNGRFLFEKTLRSKKSNLKLVLDTENENRR